MVQGRVRNTNQSQITKLTRIEAREEDRITVNGWRAQLHDESRRRITNKIMECLKKHIPVSGPDGLKELMKIAVHFEKKIYYRAASQTDYLRKISLKMLTLETRSQNRVTLPPHTPGNSSKPLEPDS